MTGWTQHTLACKKPYIAMCDQHHSGSTQVPSTTTTCRQTTITTAKNVIPNFAGVRALSGASFQSYRAGNADTIFNANNFCKCQIHAGSHPIVTAVPAISVVEIDKEIDEEELPPLID